MLHSTNMRIVIGIILNPWLENCVHYLQNQFTELEFMDDWRNLIDTQLEKTI